MEDASSTSSHSKPTTKKQIPPYLRAPPVVSSSSSPATKEQILAKLKNITSHGEMARHNYDLAYKMLIELKDGYVGGENEEIINKAVERVELFGERLRDYEVEFVLLQMQLDEMMEISS
ncbi:hypothetical protein GLAREA_06729 [Glarea lozoyensis ATCC 20868]|uniref:Uncharacterized protein n=1 Tax=Glarea lozoyensis (strain ATCC 20868 / MF5171) TaxID=1116229 RepID=S3DNP2_GLAL2|nr:uncharacterized protein GLAREA_06729 [Glarea lozoyensis ATCC 20868]EPE33716.1 hypothetical protein GLAREA_06729 [Glarea lozoyensis ATCC 20868]